MTALQDDDSTQNTLEVVLFQAGGCLSAIAASQVGAMSSDNNVCDAIPIAEVFGMEQVTTELAQKKTGTQVCQSRSWVGLDRCADYSPSRFAEPRGHRYLSSSSPTGCAPASAMATGVGYAS